EAAVALFPGPFDSPEQADDLLSVLAASRRELQLRLADLRVLAADQAALMQPDADPAPPRRRGRRDRDEPAEAISAEQRELIEARLASTRLQIAVVERQIALLDAQRAYLERSRPERVRSAERVSREAQQLQRDLEEASAQASEALREAEAQAQQARDQERVAVSQAELVLSNESARLAEVAAAQARFRQHEVIARARDLRAILEQIDSALRSLDDLPSADQRYRVVLGELTQIRVSNLSVLVDTLRGAYSVPEPDRRLSARVRELPDPFAESRVKLERQRAELAAEAKALEHELDGLLWQYAVELHHQVEVLNRMRIELFDQLSSAERSRRLGLNWTTVHELEGEAIQAGDSALYWAWQRMRDVHSVVSDWSMAELATIGAALWWLVEITLILIFLRMALRRWDTWMLTCIELIGTTMHLDNWTLLLVRVIDFARNFGPPLLVLIASIFVYWRLGGHNDAPVELQLGYIFVFWIAAFRCQQRLAESLARFLGARAAAQRSEAQDSSGRDRADADAASGRREVDVVAAAAMVAPVPSDHKQLETTPPVATSDLFIRTWRVLSGYVAITVIVLDLIDFAVGQGVAYRLFVRLAWLGVLPLAVWGLHRWRIHIVDAYTEQWGSDSPITQLTRKHAERLYGPIVVAVVLVITVGRRLASLTRQALSGSSTTKSVLAFFFRRRVERHAAEHGRVLDKPHELPQAIRGQFAEGELDAASCQFTPAFLHTVADVFTTWTGERRGGSVMLVGDAGMGKSTALNLLEGTLGQPVLRCTLRHKYTAPAAMIARLAELLLSHHPNDGPLSESDLVTRLTARFEKEGRQIVAIDNCHNLFLRKVGGFEAWEAFTRIINTSSDRIFWVLTCDRAAWDYL
ncbi:MAG: AAA family ATPase, partial [Myxococcota bacterium]